MSEMEPILDETKGGEHLRLILVAAPLGWDGGTRVQVKMSMRIFVIGRKSIWTLRWRISERLIATSPGEPKRANKWAVFLLG